MRTLLLIMTLLTTACASAAAPPAEAPAADSLDQLQLTKLDGSPLPAAELRGKVVLFVNVASKCGFTPQYEGLQALYEAKQGEGLVIVGVPCNQFLKQEPGSADEIATFCKVNYGVSFPLLQKQDVNGQGRSDLYRWLVGSAAGAGKNIKWNFEKFLVGRDGEVRARWASATTPEDAELRAAIDAALGEK